ncbi:uncharacterized protein LOC130994163 [Salvia miltiorrhiza]|uniref:uncharacterized protein LOC130994163 n=1 Tax=Salvia miltiorrhiza TaxID=226208 RepID=UPI0025AD9278|nr:uncharacterized protein LOC130994163 [Salvia miltiorrhiza]
MPRRKDLSTFERASIIQFLLEDIKEGKVARGKIAAAVTRWSSSRSTINQIWAAAKKQIQQGELIASLDLSKRSTIRRLACGIQCSKSTVGRWIKLGLIKAHSNAIEPDLTAPNKLLRLRFSLEALEYDRIMRSVIFKNMHNTIHIDEKWFYITKSNQRFYLTPAETEPHRTCKNKKFITKVMFMCAVCKPIFSPDGECLFDGKIDIFPFTEMVPAKRKSKNREAGTMEWKPIQSITKEVAKWPSFASKVIYIQQDNARPHIKDNDPDFRAAASSDGFDIHLLSAQTLNKVFLSLQSCMIEILKVKGQNCYKIPHLKKDALIRQDMLPLNLEVDSRLVRECIVYLIEHGSISGSEGFLRQLPIGMIGGTIDGLTYSMQ